MWSLALQLPWIHHLRSPFIQVSKSITPTVSHIFNMASNTLWAVFRLRKSLSNLCYSYVSGMPVSWKQLQAKTNLYGRFGGFPWASPWRISSFCCLWGTLFHKQFLATNLAFKTRDSFPHSLKYAFYQGLSMLFSKSKIPTVKQSSLSICTVGIVALDGWIKGDLGWRLQCHWHPSNWSKGWIRANICLRIIPWVPVIFDLTSKVTLDTSIQGNITGQT